MQEEVKIIYCYNKNKEPIHYSKAIKGETYYCIDCGAELIVKEGNIKAKHLAHKNTNNCGGTGESIFHKHWKENLFKEGLYINVINNYQEEAAEILNVLNEVSLKKRYNMDHWDKDIVVDILLETTLGDIIVEIYYSNPKDWLALEKYYSQLKEVNYIYELQVTRYINEPLIWCNAKVMMKNLIDKQNKLKKEKEMMNTPVTYKCYLNYMCKPIKITESLYNVNCITIVKGKSHFTFLEFDLTKLNITHEELSSLFNITKGFYSIDIETIKGLGLLEKYKNTIKVVKYSQISKAHYNKDIYAQVCRINKYNTNSIKDKKKEVSQAFGDELFQLGLIKEDEVSIFNN